MTSLWAGSPERKPLYINNASRDSIVLTMDTWWDRLDPEIRECCLYDNARAAKGLMTPANLNFFFIGSINAASQIIFQLCVSMLAQLIDLPGQLLILTKFLQFTVSSGRVNIFYFLVETYGEPISTYARVNELYLRTSDKDMLDALIWSGCIEYTEKFKLHMRRIHVPVRVWSMALERFIQNAPVQFLQDWHDELEDNSPLKKMLMYHLPHRLQLCAIGLYVRVGSRLENADESVMDLILRLATRDGHRF